MKVVLVAPGNSIHTVRWANGLSDRGIIVHLVTLHQVLDSVSPGIILHRLKGQAPYGYILAASELKRLIAQIDPDVVNVHFATGYGSLGRLAGLRRSLLSVWGSDVYSYPDKSIFHKAWLVSTLKSYNGVASTSQAMLTRVKSLYDHPQTFVTPFGIDIDTFKPASNRCNVDQIVIGTVKLLKKIYGVDVLLCAFARVYFLFLEVNPALAAKLKLRIVGDGPEMDALQSLALKLKIDHVTEFTGQVEHQMVPSELNKMDVYVALSREESFGVAILEASACQLPVIVSEADGPKEVTLDGRTGFVVPIDDVQAATNALTKLIESNDLRASMGIAGRQFVESKFSWAHSVDNMISAYRVIGNIG